MKNYALYIRIYHNSITKNSTEPKNKQKNSKFPFLQITLGLFSPQKTLKSRLFYFTTENITKKKLQITIRFRVSSYYNM